jgi:putative transposase
MLCRMLNVSRSGYDAWRRRGPSRRALEDSRLGTLIVASHRDGRGTYGSPRVLDDLDHTMTLLDRGAPERLPVPPPRAGEIRRRCRVRWHE